MIDPAAAAVVRRIFAWAAEGEGRRAIAHRLNAEGIRPPRPRANRALSPSWSPGALQTMLENRLYIDEVTYGRTRYSKLHSTGRRRSTDRPMTDWHTREDPELAIVDRALWHRVQELRAQRRGGPRGASVGHRGRGGRTLVGWAPRLRPVRRRIQQRRTTRVYSSARGTVVAVPSSAARSSASGRRRSRPASWTRSARPCLRLRTLPTPSNARSRRSRRREPQPIPWPCGVRSRRSKRSVSGSLTSYSQGHGEGRGHRPPQACLERKRELERQLAEAEAQAIPFDPEALRPVIEATLAEIHAALAGDPSSAPRSPPSSARGRAAADLSRRGEGLPARGCAAG